MAKPLGHIHVYVIGAPDGPQAIGVATDAAFQCVMFQISNIMGLQVLYMLDVKRSDAIQIEQFAHNILEDKRVCGAWFDVRAEQAIAAVNAAHQALLRGEL